MLDLILNGGSEFVESKSIKMDTLGKSRSKVSNNLGYIIEIDLISYFPWLLEHFYPVLSLKM